MSLKKYSFEITHIIQELENLERGIFYENGVNGKSPGTASAKTIARNVKESFIELIDKIENNKESTGELFGKINKKINKGIND